MVGQEHVLRAMINALDQGRLHHAYLFTGTRGVGKTTIARILAKSLNCETGITSTPCGTCGACREIDEGRFVDLIEVDAASRTKVEDTRELLENVQYAPTRGRYKVYLIDEVHMLSGHSFNALLKTLEEPPLHVKFLLATTDPQKLPVTILSRCLQFSLKAMPAERIVGHLQKVLSAEGVEFEDAALWGLARAAQGSMRDAMSLTDQAIAFGAGAVRDADVAAMLGTLDRHQAWRLMEPLAAGDAPGLFAAFAALATHSPDYSGLLADVLQLLHRMATAQIYPDAVDNSEGDRQQIIDFAGRMSPEDVQLYYQIALTGRRDLAHAPDPRSGFEMTFMRMLMFRPVPPEGGERAIKPSRPVSGSSPSAPQPGGQASRPDLRAVTTSPPPRTVQGGNNGLPSQGVSSVPVASGGSIGAVPASTAPSVNPYGVTAAVASSVATSAAVAAENVPSTPPLESGTLIARTDNVVDFDERRREEGTLAPDAWHTLVEQLGLTGPALNFARNCALERCDGTLWVFALSPGHQMLSQPGHLARLEEQLSHHVGAGVKIRVDVRESGQESPAGRVQRLRREAGQKAESAFRDDGFVQALVREFDAVIETHSIRPL